MKLYYPKSHYHPDRWYVFPLLKPFIKAEGYTDADRIKEYGVSKTDFEFTDEIAEADLVILTMAWNYYVKTNQTTLAIGFVKQCQNMGKKIVAINVGDSGVRIPFFENLVVLRYGGYKSKFSKNEFAFPSIIKDPLHTFFYRQKIFLPVYNSKPVVGFCGKANPSKIDTAKEIFKIAYNNLKFHSGFSSNEPQTLSSSTSLRVEVLNSLQRSPEVTSNFIFRKKYRAGVTSAKEEHNTTLEFYENLRDSFYGVCVRGVGNFSVRFYETLAMGRIPVLIDTDCALPFDDKLDWKNHVVWIKYKDRMKVAEKVVEYHKSMSPEEFLELLEHNRKLWESKLTLKGFFKNFLIRTI